jgi:single-stranded-DNA-specific exonuclease
MKSTWKLLETDADIKLMSETLGISPFAAKVLANRGIRSRNDAIRFLNPASKFMHAGSLLRDMDKVVEMISDAIKTDRKIAVYGDYDVDGVAGTVIMVKTLRNLGGDVTFYVPHRRHEGYGMNAAAALTTAFRQ